MGWLESTRKRLVVGHCCKRINMLRYPVSPVSRLVQMTAVRLLAGVQSFCNGAFVTPGICKHSRGHVLFWSIHHFAIVERQFRRTYVVDTCRTFCVIGHAFWVNGLRATELEGSCKKQCSNCCGGVHCDYYQMARFVG